VRAVVPKLLAAITIAARFMAISAFVTSHVAFVVRVGTMRLP
jgi:hypothetical protein